MDVAAFLPETFSAAAAVFLIAASVIASATTAAFGVGGGVVMLVLMGLFMPVSALIPVHGLVQLGSNLGRAFHMRRAALPSLVLPFSVGGVLGAWAGGSAVVELPDAALKVFLALFIVVVTWTKLPRFPAARSPLVLGVGGAVTTALTMFLGATGPLVAALMSRAFDTRQEVVANSAVAMAVQHVLKVAVFGLLGFNLAPWLPLAAAMILSGYLGTIAGARLLDSMDEDAFRFWFRMAVTVLALELLRRAVF